MRQDAGQDISSKFGLGDELGGVWQRRRVLQLMSGAALLAVVGCSSSSDDDEATATAAATGSAGTATSVATTAANAASSASAVATATTVAASGTSAKVLAAVTAFLATLDASQKTTAVAERMQANLSQWSNLPDQLFKRAGLRMDTLTEAQQKGVLAIFEAALSPEGYAQVLQITTADGVLAASGGQNLDFGADHYWIRFIGTPSASTAWTVQYGGHHLALNVTVIGTKMTLAPTLWGAQPAMYASSGTNFEPLQGETNKAFALMESLDATQQAAATFTSAVREIVLGAGQDGKTLVAEGAKASTFTAAQKELLLALVQEWLTTISTEHSAAKLTLAKAEVDLMTFGWYGGTRLGQPIYYRVQSPSFVIEFAHQQGMGANSGGVDHIHSIYREVGNDYGAGLAA